MPKVSKTSETSALKGTIKAMITTLTGDNAYGLTRALAERRDSYISEFGDIALERIDGAESPIERINESLQSAPFLASKKLVIVSEPSKQKSWVENYEHIIAAIPESTDVILVEPHPDKRTAYYKWLVKNTAVEHFDPLDAPKLASWASATVEQSGGSITLADATYLVERVGINQQLIASEIEKLLLYKPDISRETIELLVDATPQSTIFQLLEAAFNGDTARALELYDEQRALKVEPQQIIAMLTWQLHILTIIKTAGDRSAEVIAADAGLNPYVVRKSSAIARRLSATKLREIISQLLAIDIDSKRSAINIDDGLRNYILSLQ